MPDPPASRVVEPKRSPDGVGAPPGGVGRSGPGGAVTPVMRAILCAVSSPTHSVSPAPRAR